MPVYIRYTANVIAHHGMLDGHQLHPETFSMEHLQLRSERCWMKQNEVRVTQIVKKMQVAKFLINGLRRSGATIFGGKTEGKAQ